MVDRLSLDFEAKSEAQLTGAKSVGIYNYMQHPSTKPTMLAWTWNSGRIEQADFARGDTLPPEVIDGLLDPHVEKWAFNAAFERLMTRICLEIDTPIQGWRCSMALAYMRSFNGGLDDVGTQIGVRSELRKDKRGSDLIKLFCMPQRVTKNQPLLWRDHITDPDRWDEFLDYNRQDVFAEDRGIYQKLIGYGVPTEEWELYEADQEINDRGLPVDRLFVHRASEMAKRRKAELAEEMRELSGYEKFNPSSTQQLLPWLQERGYPWTDLQKATIRKVLVENKEGENKGFLDEEAVAMLRMRQQVSRTSVQKYDAILRRMDPIEDRLRHCFQFAGASRTNRWSGRGPQPQNLVRTPKEFEARDGSFSVVESVTDAIRDNDYDLLNVLVDEPMYALAGAIRSSFRAPEGYELVVADLSAIESAVIAWLSACPRLLSVFRNGLDPYKDFGTELYAKPYAEITKDERTICKPPTLGCGFGLGGGSIKNGKKTGLWGYAEGMGVHITKEEAKRQVDLYRSTYKEIPDFWKKIEKGCQVATKGGTYGVNGLLKFERDGPFMKMILPSSRPIFYHLPQVREHEFPSNDGGTYKRRVFSCMGKSQVTNKWCRILSGGPKVCENAVQGTARDVLASGVRNARREGFTIVGTVHDEIIALRRKGDNYLSLELLIECMVKPDPWMIGLPLKAAGYVGTTYRKD